MVNYMLSVTAELENLTNFQPRGGVNAPNFTYYFKLKCENCGEVTDKETCVSLNEQVDLPRRAVANLIHNCKLCARAGFVTMVPGRGVPLTLHCSQTQNFTPLMVFRCDGFEPVDFLFTGCWEAKSTNGRSFNIDLNEESCFLEYFEEESHWCMVSNLRHTFKVVDLDSAPAGVFVQKLGRHVTEKEVENVFSSCGPVLGVYLDKTDRLFGGVGFVNFLGYEDALKAVQTLNGKFGWDVKLSNSSKKKASRSGRFEANEAEFVLKQTKEEQELSEEMVERVETNKIQQMFDALNDCVAKQRSVLKKLVRQGPGRNDRNPSLARQKMAEIQTLVNEGIDFWAVACNFLERNYNFILKMKSAAKTRCAVEHNMLLREVEDVEDEFQRLKRVLGIPD